VRSVCAYSMTMGGGVGWTESSRDSVIWEPYRGVGKEDRALMVGARKRRTNPQQPDRARILRNENPKWERKESRNKRGQTITVHSKGRLRRRICVELGYGEGCPISERVGFFWNG